MAAQELPGAGTAGERVVLAAGGMVVRRGAGGRLEVAVVHRPYQMDWTFPKGKADPGEPLVECALREVYEETGFRCRLTEPIGRTRYVDRKERPKVVDYWMMQRVSGSFAPGAEVDELCWVEIRAAGALLTYERDHQLLPALQSAAQAALAPRAGLRSS